MSLRVIAPLLLSLLFATPSAAQRTHPVSPGTTRGSGSLVVRPVVAANPGSLDFGTVPPGTTQQLPLALMNTGKVAGWVQSLQLRLDGAGNGQAWEVDFDGTILKGQASTTVPVYVQRKVAPGASIPITVTFAPTPPQYDALVLRLVGNFHGGGTTERIDVPLTGLGGSSGASFLHADIDAPPYAVDYDADGSESVFIEGEDSHTNQPGHSIAAYEWSENGSVFSTAVNITPTLALGTHTITLTVYDDNTPPNSAQVSHDISIVVATAVPGVLARYYDAGTAPASSLLDAIPAKADFGEILSTTQIGPGNTVGSSGLVQNTMVRLTAILEVQSAGTYDLLATGGTDRRLDWNGAPYAGPLTLAPGSYPFEARFAISDAATDLPVSVTLSTGGGPAGTPDASLLTHDETALEPILNSMPTVGTDAGGNLITILGLGFFPDTGVQVHWGATTFTESDFSELTPDQISFTSPPGSGSISVTVETPNGTTKPTTFQYSPSGPVPIDFDLALTPPVTHPTAAVFGPDRRLYVITVEGELHAFTFDDSYSAVTSEVVYPGVSGLSNANALGITVNPFDPPSPVRLYVGHGQHFVNGGGPFTGPSPYTGQVSVLEGPTFATPVPLITGLPTSNHDHAVNGLQFDNNGDLFIAVGSNTNAGVRAPGSGNLPESPLSAAILKAFTSKPGFNGTITYSNSSTGQPSDDQVEGEEVDVDPGVDVVVHAPGHRNPYGLLYTTQKRLYATDNGPNIGFGAASTGPQTELPDPFDTDELNFVEYDVYAGHPNRSRARWDPRQYIYRGSLTNPVATIPGEFRQMAAWLPPSSDGLDEYRANTFQGQIRGWLIVQEYLDDLRRVAMTSDGRAGWSQAVISPATGGLSVVCLPGGALCSIDYNGGRLVVLTPNDASAVGLVAQDIFPWRAPATGGVPFTIGGIGFGGLGNTSVTIGGLPATLSRVSPTRIEGILPANPSPTKALVDVVVTVGQDTSVLPAAFRFLGPIGTETGDWESLPALPTALGEVAAGEIDGVLYVIGAPAVSTYRYDLLNKVWMGAGSPRPYPGDHHSAEVVGGRLYLIGGLGAGSEGKVQIYDPTNDTWSTGAPMPWAGGSVNTCVIGGKIYAAGGIVGSNTVPDAAVYDPVLDTWTALAPMPDGRNHAAAGTDGTAFWIFGGREGGNVVTNGLDQTFRFDPTSGTWQSSDDPGSSLQPLPQARGGMGKAVFYRGEFYVFGGETWNGPGATQNGVYDRVDVYDPKANTWRLDEPMPNPRHGIFPVLFESRMFLPGGGSNSGSSQSTILDAFSRQ
ncbi:MAG TPA: hypothetical protein ENJ09_09995 [Planctomycetes bacterium]|nr:hypothetical protein [Planctomycetota bacterium]